MVPMGKGSEGPWAQGLMGPRAHGPMGPRARGPQGPCAHGSKGPRVHGPKDGQNVHLVPRWPTCPKCPCPKDEPKCPSCPKDRPNRPPSPSPGLKLVLLILFRICFNSVAHKIKGGPPALPLWPKLQQKQLKIVTHRHLNRCIPQRRSTTTSCPRCFQVPAQDVDLAKGLGPCPVLKSIKMQNRHAPWGKSMELR